MVESVIFQKKSCLKSLFRASLSTMKRISLILASLALLFSTKASALSGGPFDNGDYNSLLDNSGVYQMACRYTNGSGFAQFGNNVDVATFVDTGAAAGGGGTATRSSTYSVWNRSLFYYKGVTYLGTCYGIVDHELKEVSGVTNGNSDVGTNTLTAAGGAGATGAGTNVTASSTVLLNNGNNGLSCNSEFRCKITATYPILRFSGEGELSVLNPSLGQISLNAIQAIITSAVNADTSDVDTAIDIGAQISSLVDAIVTNQTDLAAILPTTTQLRNTSDFTPMSVYGSRIFFVSRR